jgi:hypothetical protein
MSTASGAGPIQEACFALSPSAKRKEEGKKIKIKNSEKFHNSPKLTLSSSFLRGLSLLS